MKQARKHAKGWLWNGTPTPAIVPKQVTLQQVERPGIAPPPDLDKHRQREERAMEERKRCMAMQREQNASLAGSLSDLSSLRVEENSLEASIKLLETCVQ